MRVNIVYIKVFYLVCLIRNNALTNILYAVNNFGKNEMKGKSQYEQATKPNQADSAVGFSSALFFGSSVVVGDDLSYRTFINASDSAA